MTYGGIKHKAAHTLTLFSSFSTLLCCALPALLVALGAGSVMAGLVSTIPALVVVSHHKPIVFTFAGVMLTISGIMQWRGRYAPCPADPAKAEACKRLRKYSAIVYGISLLAYLTGGFFAFVAPYVIQH